LLNIDIFNYQYNNTKYDNWFGLTINESFFMTLERLNISKEIINIKENQIPLLNSEDKILLIHKINKICKTLGSNSLLYWLNKYSRNKTREASVIETNFGENDQKSNSFLNKFFNTFGLLFEFNQTNINQNLGIIGFCIKIVHDQMMITKKTKACSYTYYNLIKKIKDLC